MGAEDLDQLTGGRLDCFCLPRVVGDFVREPGAEVGELDPLPGCGAMGARCEWLEAVENWAVGPGLLPLETELAAVDREAFDAGVGDVEEVRVTSAAAGVPASRKIAVSTGNGLP
jgi:hypothetical protein